jgi:hypothetical protein
MKAYVLFFGDLNFYSTIGYIQVASSLTVLDTRSQTSLPFNYAREVKFEFKERAVIGLPGSMLYRGLFTFAPWSVSSGGPHHQLGFIGSAIYYRTGLPQTASWTTWNQFIIANGSGDVGIGTANPGFKLDVIGTVRAREVKVDMNGTDFVFNEN